MNFNYIHFGKFFLESLDSLEKMVVEMFADVMDKNVEAPKWPEHPFKEEHFQCKWYIVPIKDIRNLNITFPIPDVQEYFRSAVSIFVSEMIEDFFYHIEKLMYGLFSASALFITFIRT